MLHNKLFPFDEGSATFGLDISGAKWGYLNLGVEAHDFAKNNVLNMLNPLLDPKTCEEWVKSLHVRDNIECSYGGYMEDRHWLWRNHYHRPGHTIHVGIDYNVPVGTKVCLPDEGKLIMMEEDPDPFGGWGSRAIFKIRDLYVTFAHILIDETIGFGDPPYWNGYPIGEVAESNVNGGWYPHLHVQCQREYKPHEDAYQKTSSTLNWDYPNPEEVLT